MKTLYLIFSKLKSMILTDVFFFAVLFVGVLSCNLMFTYVYGLVMQMNERDGAPDIYAYPVEEGAIELSIAKSAVEKGKADIDFYASVDEDASEVTLSEGVTFEEVSIRTRENLSFFTYATGDAESLASSGTVIVPAELCTAKIGDTVTLNGVALKVVGTSYIPAFLVSEATFTASGFEAELISADTSVRRVDKTADALAAVLGDGYAVDVLTEGFDENSKNTFMIIVLIYALSALSFLYLMISIYDSSAYEFNVYEILGATRGKTLTVLGAVMFIFLAALSFASEAIHAILYRPLFSRLNMVEGFSYTFGDYFTVFAVSLLSVYTVVFVYIAVRTRRGSTIANGRKFIA